MKWIIVSLLLIILILVIYGICANFFFVTTHYTMKSDELYSVFGNKKIIVISDLHNCTYGKNNIRLLEKIKSIEPCCVIIAGDMVNNGTKENNEKARMFVNELLEICKVFYADGNHEQGFFEKSCIEFDEERFLNFFDNTNGNLIHMVNNYVQIGENVRIYGMRIDRSFFGRIRRPNFDNEYITKLLGKSDKNCYNILVAHNPMYFEKYAEWGADLVISGHLHGGIARIPFVGGVISPQMILFPKYTGGMYDYKGKTLILSRGLGMHTIKFRVFNEPELIVLSCEKEK